MSDNTIIADFFPCAYLCGQSGVTRDPYLAWRSISQSGVIILSAMHALWDLVTSPKKVIVHGREK